MLAAALALSLATVAQSAAVAMVELDTAARTATLRGPKDRVVTVNVPAGQ
jgi:hypothetical protein